MEQCRFSQDKAHSLQGEATTTEEKPVTISDDEEDSGDEKKKKDKSAVKTGDDSDHDDPTSSLKCDPTGKSDIQKGILAAS